MNEELIEAIRENDLERVRDLISRGVDVNYRKQGRLLPTPLILASRMGYENIIRLLIDSGVDINGTDGIGRSALDGISNENIVRILIDAGIDLNIRDNVLGYTGLMTASVDGYLSIVKMLIEAGANIYIKDINGKNVVELVNELYGNERHMNLSESLRPGYKERMKSIIKILEKAENKEKKRIAIDAYMRSKNLPSDPKNPLSGFYNSKIDEPDYIMQQVLNMAYGEDEEGAEESKSNRDAGGRKKSKNKRKKSLRKKSFRKKSRSKRRKSGKKKLSRKKSKSKRRKSTRK